MYRLFTDKPFRGLHISQNFIRAKYKYENSILDAIEYYQKYPTYLSNRHILVRIIAGFTFDPELSEGEVYRQIERNSNTIASVMGLTSNVSPGRFFKKSFYTNQCAIISLSFTNPLNIPYWKRIRAVRVLTHPHVTLRPVLANQLKSIDEKDYSVVGIDIPLLAVQYQGWIKEEFLKPENEREDITQFINKWVFPAMLPEQFDISLRNRIQYLGLDIEREEADIRPPMFVQGYDKEFNEAYEELIKYYRTGIRTLSEVMKGMPMFTSESYWEAIPRVLNGLNVYNYWVTLLVYTDWLYPIAVSFNIDPQQELISKQLLKVERYRVGVKADKFISAPVDSSFKEKYNTILNLWKQ